MITVSIEPFSSVEQHQDMIKEHWDEVASRDGGRELNVHWDAFHEMDENGALVTIVARNNDEFAGYAVFIIARQLHAKEHLIAENDALYLHPKYRHGRAGALLIKESQRILGEKYPGILVTWHVKPSLDFSGLLTRLGYNKIDTVYGIKAE